MVIPSPPRRYASISACSISPSSLYLLSPSMDRSALLLHHHQGLPQPRHDYSDLPIVSTLSPLLSSRLPLRPPLSLPLTLCSQHQFLRYVSPSAPVCFISLIQIRICQHTQQLNTKSSAMKITATTQQPRLNLFLSHTRNMTTNVLSLLATTSTRVQLYS